MASRCRYRQRQRADMAYTGCENCSVFNTKTTKLTKARRKSYIFQKVKESFLVPFVSFVRFVLETRRRIGAAFGRWRSGVGTVSK
jgi:hypothetical protein